MSDAAQQPGPPDDNVEPVSATGPLPGRSLPVAIATAVGLIVLAALFAFLGKGAFFVLAVIAVELCLFELYDSLLQRGHRVALPYGLACCLGLLVATYFAAPEWLAPIVGATALGGFVLALRPDRGSTPGSDVAWLVLGVVWIGGGGAGAVAILGLTGGLALLIAFVVTTAADDIAAYFVGTRFGRHKLAPSLSPAKSWEGFAGGMAGALAVGAAMGAALAQLGPLRGLGVGAIVTVAAPVGDLVESLIKREIGIKDSGRLLPGHGGVLDRLDAVLFCAPLVFLFLWQTPPP